MKTWLITGASRGLGLAFARAVLNAGHNVVATGRKPEVISKALGQSDRLLAVRLDVTSEPDARTVAADAVARFGSLDVVVNNAGYGQLGWFENTSDRQVRDQFETNVFGAMNVTRAVLPIMRKQKSGYVVTISSVAGIMSPAGGAVYAASKFAVEGWMEGLTKELQPLGIHATTVEPGFFKTDFLDSTSTVYADGGIADYAEAEKQFRDWHDNMNHQQVGDPAKLAAVLLKFAELDAPPARFAAGSDAIGVVLDEAEKLRAQAERWRKDSVSTDGVPESK